MRKNNQPSDISQKTNSHSAFLIWITGLSGSGKTTLAIALKEKLFKSGYQTMLLDGDTLRYGLCKDLTFSSSDRSENVRRAAEVCKLTLDAGMIVVGAFISPFESDRVLVKSIVGEENYIEIYCSCKLKACEERDPKGLYKIARAGKLINFTGIDSPYEIPKSPHLIIDSEYLSVDISIEKIINFLIKSNRILNR